MQNGACQDGLSPIGEIIEEVKNGKMVIVVDGEDRENEGDLLMAAQFVTPESVNFMITHARGLLCLPLCEEICDRLRLPPMTGRNEAQFGTNFTVSVEARSGITTGISAADRAKTIQVAVSPTAKPEDLVQPGHIFPLRAKRGGVLERCGHTEAGVDLARLAGLTPAAAICEITNADGTMARLPQLLEFSKEHGIKIGAISDLIEHRLKTESLVERKFSSPVSTEWGDFEMTAYVDKLTGETHLALWRGDLAGAEPPLVRVHEPFGALDFIVPDSGRSVSLPDALLCASKSKAAAVVLLHKTEDGQALLRRAAAAGGAREKWDSKSFGVGAQILLDLGVRRMRVLGSSVSLKSLDGFGLEVAGSVDPQSILGKIEKIG